jgi:predicted DNA-binding protein with PD1-like motif
LPLISCVSSSSPVYVWFRLEPGVDPVQGIADVIGRLGMDSGSIVQCMGSLSRITYMVAIPDEIRGWRYSDPIVRQGPMEFISAQGSWGRDAETGELVVHLHGFVIDGEGKTSGGHFVSGASRILATCEVGLLAGSGVAIRRRFDPVLGMPVLMAAPLACAECAP